MANEQSFLTVPEVAAIIRAHPLRVYALCADGTIPSIRIGKRVRVPRAAFDQWVLSSTHSRPAVAAGA